MNRRDFLKTTALIGAGTLFSSKMVASVPAILTRRKVPYQTAKGTLNFHPYFVQKGRGPNIYELVWATDENWDTFYSNISLSEKGISISDSKGINKFGINCRWNVEGFGYTNITADNGGDFYTLPPDGKALDFNLNYELAKSRVARNRKRIKLLENSGWKPSREVETLVSLSEGYYEDASKVINSGEKCALLSQEALNYALWASEKMELEKAEFVIRNTGYRKDFFLGCDARGFYEMYQDTFLKLFTPLFNYANVTYVTKGDGIINDFEPKEGDNQFAIRDVLVDKLHEYGIKTQGRLMFWFHDCCTPAWLKAKNYDELLKYAERHTREVVGHYGDRMYAWEMVNELHDWANELKISPEQSIELTRLVTDITKSIAPKVKRTINSCCLFAEYVQMHSYSGGPAVYRQRTPWQFARDVVDAGVDIDIIELQMYYPYRDLQDSILMTERYEQFRKPMHYSEVGVSGGPTDRSVKLGTVNFPKEPYLWHHPWDEETQADWLESIYTLAYSKPYIKACNWFDFVDPFSYMDNGGLLRSQEGEKKAAYYRLQNLEEKWKNLPSK